MVNFMANEKIALCVPLYGTIHAIGFANYINFLQQLEANYKVVLLLHNSTFSAASKNFLISLALNSNCDYALFYDPNLLPKAEAVEALLKHGKDFASALYFGSVDAFPNFKIRKEGKFFDSMNFPAEKLLKVDALGFGFCLMKISALKEISKKFEGKPLFDYEYLQNGNTEAIDEDLSFSKKIAECGYELYVDTPQIISGLNGVVDRNYYLAKFGSKLQKLKEKSDNNKK